MANRLDTAQSPYLRSAAGQPIHWHQWGPEAFERATREKKPILLDIGAVWCHWCHVMDHESYEDPTVAEFLNREYVCVKVDRDERPDVDGRYQRAVQGLTGQGGWPLTAFLTPTGEVFFGGTYFPPEGRHGRPGFLSVLRRARDLFSTEPDRVAEQAEQVRRFVEEQLDDSTPGEADLDLLARAARRILAFADRRFGGFGRAPKFPHPAAVALLLARWATEGEEAVRAVVVEALDAMALGGIRDHIGGGFHRYSTDERWVVPHFEKMSYDNSELLRVYADGYAAFGSSLYAESANETLRWATEVLADRGGGYGASQDADLEPGDDGSYYTWSLAELDRILSPDEARVAIARFGVGTHGRMPHDPLRNVLFVAEPATVVAERVGLPVPETLSTIDRVLAKLRAARRERPAPFVDRTRYSGWNAMMASAVLRAGQVLEDAGAVEQALATIRSLRAAAGDSLTVAHGAGEALGLLEDQVQVASAALDAFETTGDPDWLDWSRSLMEHTVTTCWDTRAFGFFDQPAAPRAPGLLDTRAKPVQDSPTPSGNGVAGVVLARLFEMLREPRWDELRRQLLSAFAGRAEELGLFASAYFQALDWAVSPVTHVVVTGPAGDPAAALLHRAALGTFLPRRIVLRLSPDTAGRLALTPALEAMVRDPHRAAAFLCLGTQCLEPAPSVAAWKERVEQAATLVRTAGGVAAR